MSKIEYRNYLPTALFVLLLVVSFLIIKPFLLAIFLGALLAYIFYPLYRWGGEKIRNKTVMALLVCLLVLVLIIVPAIFFMKTLVQESYALYMLGKQKLSTGFFEGCTNSFCNLVKELREDPEVRYQFQEGLKAVTNWVIKKGSDFLVSIPDILLNLFVMSFTLFYFLSDGKALVRKAGVYLGRRMERKKFEEIMERLKGVVRAVVYGYVLVALMQGALGALGFYLFGVSSPLFWGIMMAFLALIPYLGTGVVWIPASAMILLNGIFQDSNWLVYKGIGLFLYGFLFVGSLDNFIKPKIIGEKAKIHPALILLGIFGGVFLMGPVGVIAGPLALSLTAIVVEEYLGERKEKKEEEKRN